MLLILTAVEKVSINFNKDNQEDLDILTVSKAKEYINNNEFGKGSMLPKIEACLEYVENSKGSALITSLDKAKQAILGKTGTIIKM